MTKPEFDAEALATQVAVGLEALAKHYLLGDVPAHPVDVAAFRKVLPVFERLCPGKSQAIRRLHESLKDGHVYRESKKAVEDYFKLLKGRHILSLDEYREAIEGIQRSGLFTEDNQSTAADAYYAGTTFYIMRDHLKDGELGRTGRDKFPDNDPDKVFAAAVKRNVLSQEFIDNFRFARDQLIGLRAEQAFLVTAGKYDEASERAREEAREIMKEVNKGRDTAETRLDEGYASVTVLKRVTHRVKCFDALYAVANGRQDPDDVSDLLHQGTVAPMDVQGLERCTLFTARDAQTAIDMHAMLALVDKYEQIQEGKDATNNPIHYMDAYRSRSDFEDHPAIFSQAMFDVLYLQVELRNFANM